MAEVFTHEAPNRDSPNHLPLSEREKKCVGKELNCLLMIFKVISDFFFLQSEKRHNDNEPAQATQRLIKLQQKSPVSARSEPLSGGCLSMLRFCKR